MHKRIRQTNIFFYYKGIFLLKILFIYVVSISSNSHALPPIPWDYCNSVSKLFIKTFGQPFKSNKTKDSEKQEIKSLDELLWSFTKGFVPDLSDPQQKAAFEIYKRMRFGDPSTEIHVGSLDEIAYRLKKNKRLKKEPFRNYEVEIQEKSFPVINELTTFINTQTKSAGAVRSNLFQVEANEGYWKKILGYDVPDEFKVIPKEKKAKIDLKNRASKHFDDFFSRHFPQELLLKMRKKDVPARGKAKDMYKFLVNLRDKLEKENKDIKPISQAIVDLIHTIGYHNANIVRSLKSRDGLERLNAFKEILKERDEFATELGLANDLGKFSFDTVLKRFNIHTPTGIPDKKNLYKTLVNLEKSIVSKAQNIEGVYSKKTIRHLSITESPFRSCLGGADCSSRTYLSKALDPNYHYFTLTDESGFSSGHITIVLGNAKIGNEKVKVAFVDKVQNVSNFEIPIMMEGIRRSVAEKGYKLAIPKDLGDSNGISNEATTRFFLEKGIITSDNETFTDFKPRSHSYHFVNRYSRAEDELPLTPILPPDNNSNTFKLTSGDIMEPWQTSNFNLKKLVEASKDLKNGNLEDQLRYIPSMRAIEDAGLQVDPDYESTLNFWLKDPDTHFKLKKQVLTYEWLESGKPPLPLLDNFSKTEQITIIQNLFNTPRYRKVIINDEQSLFDLMIKFKQDQKVRDVLVESYSPQHVKAISLILEAEDIDNNLAITAIKILKKDFDSPDIDRATSVLKIIKGTSIQNKLEDSLIQNYIKNTHNNASLGRGLNASLNSNDSIVSRIGPKILDHKNDELLKNFPIAKIYSNILSIQNKMKNKNFMNATEKWIKKKYVNVQLKADFLMTLLGTNSKQFEHFISLIPKNKKREIWKKIQEATSLKVFKLISSEMEATSALLENGFLESFQFQRKFFPTGKEGDAKTFTMGESNDLEVTLTQPFEVQSTQVTQLQWAIVMGENPSHFKELGKELTINGKKIKVDPNRPVENISLIDAQEFIRKLNTFQDKYIYKLPTEAEWEFAARAGTNTRFSHGDDLETLNSHGWSKINSEGVTHTVASLHPNQFGLYDTHGNVWEWTSDIFNELPKGQVVDPEGPDFGSSYVVRGGSWDNTRGSLSSYHRFEWGAGGKFNTLGIRLFRVPKQ